MGEVTCLEMSEEGIGFFITSMKNKRRNFSNGCKSRLIIPWTNHQRLPLLKSEPASTLRLSPVFLSNPLLGSLAIAVASFGSIQPKRKYQKIYEPLHWKKVGKPSMIFPRVAVFQR